MLRNKTYFASIIVVWCFVLCGVVSSHESLSNDDDDEMLIEGHTIHSSDIKTLLADRNVSRIYVYLTDTFHVDESLELNGLKEMKVFASLWNITKPVTFDLSGPDSVNQLESAMNGSAGFSGNDGSAGGNFIGLTRDIINGDYLTVRSNGGNGANGQDGGGSDDVYVLLNADDDDSGNSGWFSGGDIISYYKTYFEERGYDAEISDVDDYTSLYAVFVHNRKVNFTVRLHPKKCCGATGIGGAGGLGGQKGKLFFYHIGTNKSQSSPRLVAYDGLIGKQGKDARTCDSLALNVRIDAELKKVIFIFVPLHHSFSSQFTVLNHTSSGKCEPLYVTTDPPNQIDSNEIDFSSAILQYRSTLLKYMKQDASRAMVLQETYRAIDINNRIRREDSLNVLLSEAMELERIYSELKNSIDMALMYERLLDRVERVLFTDPNKDDELSLTHLRSILYFKLDDMRALSDSSFIVNLEQFAKSVATRIELGYRLFIPITKMTDSELQNDLNELMFNVHGHSFLDQYQQVIEWFHLIYFPFAFDYLEKYRLPSSPSSYADLNAIVSMTTSHLNTLSLDIRDIHWNNSAVMLDVKHMITTDPQNAIYMWRNADIRNDIRQLFDGKKITLLADVKRSKLNALKFNTIDVVLRSSDGTVNDRLKIALNGFQLNVNHTGRSSFRCNSHFYQIDAKSTFLIFHFAENRSQMSRNDDTIADKLSDNYPILSPFTLWEIQIVGSVENSLQEIAQFRESNIDIELHVTGKYLKEEAEICDANLSKLYTEI